MKQKLSIIVPVFNDAKHLCKSLESLIRQTEEVVVIVVDDGSTDGSGEIAKEYADKYSNVICKRKENEGIASARNFGVAQVETEYFGFLDSDDYVEPDMAELMLKKIEEEKADICFSNFIWKYEDGSTRITKDIDFKDKKDILVNMMAVLWNKIYRTEWFRNNNISFPDGYRYEDASVLYKSVIRMDRVAYVDKVFVSYVQRTGSITRTFNVNINDMIHVFEDLDEYYKANTNGEYKDEIEYLFIRFFLGNSYLRACRIIDKKVRKETLDKGWNCLVKHYPNFKNNRYLKNSGMKNRYFSLVDRNLYYGNVSLFKIAYRLGIMK